MICLILIKKALDTGSMELSGTTYIFYNENVHQSVSISEYFSQTTLNPLNCFLQICIISISTDPPQYFNWTVNKTGKEDEGSTTLQDERT